MSVNIVRQSSEEGKTEIERLIINSCKSSLRIRRELKQEHKVVGLIHLFQADKRAVWAYEIGYTYEAVSYVMQ